MTKKMFNVPFFQQTTPLNCGPTALRMVFSYLGQDFQLHFIEEKCGIKAGKGVSTVRLAIGAAKLGFRVQLFSKSLYFHTDLNSHQYYAQYGDVEVEESKKLIKEAEHVGVELHEKTLTQEEILAKVSENTTAIVLLDWNHIMKKTEKGYQGHFVPIVGWEHKHIVVHNQSHLTPEMFMHLEKDLFESARKAKGTDEDILFISAGHAPNEYER